MNDLRDYQQEDVGRIFNEWEQVKSVLYHAATGLGKTRVMSEVAKRMLPKRMLFLCDRAELIFQAHKTFSLHGIECQIEKAELSASTNLFTRTPAVLASVQTMLSGEVDMKRMRRFNPMDFGLLLYDECDCSVSPGNKSIVEYFTGGNPDIRVLGVTATTDRTDEKALGQIYETVVGDRDILFGIQNGWLVEPLQQMVHVQGIDFSHVRTTAGDLNGKDLSAVMEAEEPLHAVVVATLEAMYGHPQNTLKKYPTEEWAERLTEFGTKPKRTIVFTVSVAQAETLSGIFNRVIPGIASWLCGKTPDREREQIFQDFYNGKTAILVNCGVTTRGYDNPYVELISMARPTKSRRLYAQMVGRGTRTLPGIVDGLETKEERLRAIAQSGKPHCAILDFIGNSGKHKLVSVADALGGNYSDEAVELAVKKAKSSSVPVNMTQAMIDAEEELRKKAEKARLATEARKRRIVAKVTYTSTRINPFDVLDIIPIKAHGWDSGKVLSEKQRGILLKMGVAPDTIPYAQGRQLVIEQIRRWSNKLASVKQIAALKRIGHQFDPHTLTREQASAMFKTRPQQKPIVSPFFQQQNSETHGELPIWEECE